MAREIDWAAIKAEYTAGSLSIRQIASMYNCSARAIDKRAKTDGWGERRKLVRRRRSPKNRKSAPASSADQAAEDSAAALVPQALIVSDVALVHPLERVFDLLDRQRSRARDVLNMLDVLLSGLQRIQRERLEAMDAGQAIPHVQLVGMMLAESEVLSRAAKIMGQLHGEERRLFGLQEDLPTEIDRMAPEDLQRLRAALRRAISEVKRGD